jgi:hypothetical protein
LNGRSGLGRETPVDLVQRPQRHVDQRKTIFQMLIVAPPAEKN